MQRNVNCRFPVLRLAPFTFLLLMCATETVFAQHQDIGNTEFICSNEPLPTGYIRTTFYYNPVTCGGLTFPFNAYVVERLKREHTLCSGFTYPSEYVVIKLEDHILCPNFAQRNAFRIALPRKTERVCDFSPLPYGYEFQPGTEVTSLDCTPPFGGLIHNSFIIDRVIDKKEIAGSALGSFSIFSNPSGDWSYGYTVTRGSLFILYTRGERDLLNAGLDSWSTPNSVEPLVAHSYTGGTVNWLTIIQPPDVLNLHPGPSGENSVVRWTAPKSGTYLFQGSFQGLDLVGPTSTDVAILHNSVTAVFNGVVNSYGGQLSFSITRQVVVGDTVDFSVGFGTNGNHLFDSTGLKVTISKSH